MSANRYKPHLYVLPEDEANRQLATGFQKNCDTNQVQVLNEARGWSDVCNLFVSDHIREMNAYSARFMLLLVDFDNVSGRMAQVKSYIPANLASRTFILGVQSEPENLRSLIGSSYEEIGEKMALDCRNGTNSIWGHALLAHNATEVARLCNVFGAMLFT